MVDLIVWVFVIIVAFIALKYVPMNMTKKGKLLVWLSGCLVSSLALLAAITYTFWIGVSAAMLLSLVLSIFMQNRISPVPADTKENPMMEEITAMENSSAEVKGFEEFDHADDLKFEQPAPLVEKHEESSSDVGQTEFEEEVEADVNPQRIDEDLEDMKGNDSDLSESSAAIELPPEDEIEEIVTYPDTDSESLEDFKIIGGIYENNETSGENLLPEEELAASRSNAETDIASDNEKVFEGEDENFETESQGNLNLEEQDVPEERIDFESMKPEEKLAASRELGEVAPGGKEVDNEAEVTEEELIAERNKQLNDAIDFTMKYEEEFEDMELEEKENSRDGKNFTENISKEMDLSKQSVQSEKLDEINVDLPVNDCSSPADIEDDEDSLLLEEKHKDSLVADEELRKQLLDVMIEKISYMEKQLDPDKYEKYIKAHLSSNLPDLEYYSIAQYLLKFYMKQGKTDVLRVFVEVLIEKMAPYPLILDELNYLRHQQVIDTK
ncbi:hypothetical protein [Halobacillus litoralis]|uniref:hypothetical protein n=1 Tax=Halobacillus litoralis TaxID=45668 RepID=UPI00248F8A4E|nr:hypothetical protein [Halobacillus litoralis]